MPEIKKNYIDTGKVKLIIRDFPLNGPAYAAAMMARCAKPERREQFIERAVRESGQLGRGRGPEGGA